MFKSLVVILLLATTLVPALPGQTTAKSDRDYYREIKTIPADMDKVCFSDADADGAFFLLGTSQRSSDILHVRFYFRGVPNEEWFLWRGREDGAPWKLATISKVDKSKGRVELFLNDETGRYRMVVYTSNNGPEFFGSCSAIRFRKDTE